MAEGYYWAAIFSLWYGEVGSVADRGRNEAELKAAAGHRGEERDDLLCIRLSRRNERL